MTNRDACMGFLAGAITGAAVALLYAPMSGRDTRERIAEKGEEAKQRATELGQKAKDSLMEAKAGAEQKVADAAAGIAGAGNRLTNAAAARTS